MKIVYATGSERLFEFYMTSKREAVPQDATVFAICEGERTIENQDEDLFAAISDEDYFTLRKMVSEAEQLETKLYRRSAKTFGQLFRKFFRGLRALLSGQSARARARAERLSTYRAGRRIVQMQLCDGARQ